MFLSPKQNSYVCMFSRGQLHPSTFLHSLISLVILVAYVIIFISATNERWFTFDRGQLLVPSSPREFPPGNISGKDSNKRELFSVDPIGGICLQIHTRWDTLEGELRAESKDGVEAELALKIIVITTRQNNT